MAVVDRKGRRALNPVAAPRRWVVLGLLLQLIGVGGPAAFLITKARHDNIGSHITAATVRLAWHGQIHTHTGMAVLVARVALFAVGSVVMAHPYATRPVTLLVAVPVAAVAGVLVLGAIALLVAAAIAAFDGFDFGSAPDATKGSAQMTGRRPPRTDPQT